REQSNPHSALASPRRVGASRGFLPRGLYDACPGPHPVLARLRLRACIVQPLTDSDGPDTQATDCGAVLRWHRLSLLSQEAVAGNASYCESNGQTARRSMDLATRSMASAHAIPNGR